MTRKELEARFCELYVEQARLKTQARAIHDDLMRIQGMLQVLPDDPPPAPPAPADQVGDN